MSMPAVLPDPRRWKALAFICFAQLMVVVDGTVVNIALPSAQRDLGMADGDRQWVVSAYALAFGGLLLLGGRIADRVGRKRAFLAGVVGFALASALGAVAANTAMLLGARALQGCFGALLAPAALSLVTVMFTESGERAKAFGIWGAITGGGAAVGLMLGGVLTQYLNWRWTLLVNVFFAAVAAAGAVAVVREPLVDRHRGRLDVPGALLSSGGLACLVYGLTKAETDGWRARSTTALLAVAGVALVTFVIVEWRVKTPLLPLRVVWNRNRGGAYLSLGLAVIGLFGVFLFLTYYLQVVLRYTPVVSGAAFLPMVAGMMVGSTQISARLMTRVRPRYLMPPGFLIAAAGMVLLAHVTADSSYRDRVLPGLVLLGFGMGCAFMPAMSLATAGVDPRDAGVASAMVNTSQQIGGAIGTALLSTLALSSTTRYAKAHTAPAAHGDSTAAAQTSDTLQLQAVVHGYTTAFWWAAGLLAAAAVTAFVLINHRHDAVTAPIGLEVADVRDVPLLSDAIPAQASWSRSSELPSFAAVGGEPADADAQAPDRHESEPGPVGARPASDRVPYDRDLRDQPPAFECGVPIHGTVRDPDGAPVDTAMLTLISAQGRQVSRARADSRGAYRLSAPNEGSYLLITVADGHQPQASTVIVGDGPLGYDILLADTGGLAVQVCAAADGMPVSGATIVVTDASGDVVASARTGESGAFTFRDLPLGAFTLTVDAAGYRPTALSVDVGRHGMTAVEVQLAAGAQLAGTVRAAANNRPLADARITLLDAAGNVAGTATSDQDGNYAFADLNAGDYTLIASGYPPVATALRVDGRGRSGHDVQLGHPDR